MYKFFEQSKEGKYVCRRYYIHIVSELHSANYNNTPLRDRLWQMIKIVANYQKGQNLLPPFSSGLATLQSILAILSDCFDSSISTS